MAKASLVQYATGHAESGSPVAYSVSATLASSVTAHHMLLCILGYYDPSGTFASALPEVTVTDTAGNVYGVARQNQIPTSYGIGGNMCYYVFACPDALPTTGANVVTATSLAHGNFLFGVMEWAPASTGGAVAGPAWGMPGLNYNGGESYYGPAAISGDLYNNGAGGNGGMGPWIWGADPAFDYLGDPITQYGQVYISFVIQRTDLVGPVLPVQGSTDPNQRPTHLFQVANTSAGIGTLDVWAQEEAADYSQARSVIILYLDKAQAGAIGAQFVMASGAAYPQQPVDSPRAYFLQGNGVVRYSGVYYLPINVTFTQTQQNVVLYYNTGDGTQADPTTSSTPYTGPISVASSTTIKVLAHDPTGFYHDEVWSYKYTIQSQPQDGTNDLCLEITDDTTTLPEPSMNLAIQQLDSVLNGAYTYQVLDQTARQILDGYAVDISQHIVLILTGALTHDVTITFADPSRPANNPTDTTHPSGRNPLGYYTATRPYIIINNTTGGHSITLESEPSVTPNYVMSGAGPKFLYNGGLLGVREIV
jgi:hypothetical protein